MDIGAELRQAREKAGLSIQDITRRTKIQAHKIEALENNEFEQLPEGIYLDGIVQAYAAEVGLDAETSVDRVRQQAAGALTEWVPASTDDVDAFPHEEVFAPEQIPEATTRMAIDDLDTIDRARADDYAGAAVVTPTLDHSRAPLGPRRLAVPALAVIAAAGWGAYLYQVWRPVEPSTTGNSAAAAANSDVQSSPAPVPVENPTTPAAPESSTVTRADTTNVPAQPAAPDRRREVAEAQAPTNPTTAAPITSTSPAPKAETGTEAPVAIAPESVTREPPVTNADAIALTGAWLLATRVETTSYKRFNALRLGYQLELVQSGDRVTGTGRKISESGQPLPPDRQTPITVEGTIQGDRIQLYFSERGARRVSEGLFDLQISDASLIRGRFTSDAAQSAGTVELRRTSPR